MYKRQVEGLHKIYGDFHALNGINEEIHKGEVVVVVGPSGSGKSTFLRSLNLLEVPDQGHIYFEGVDITDKHVDINKHRQKDVYKRQSLMIPQILRWQLTPSSILRHLTMV